MSLNSTLIVDAVAHACDNRPETRNANRYAAAVVDGIFAWQEALVPPEYVLEKQRYFSKITPEVLTSALFYESQVDIACFHGLPMWGIFKDYSPTSVGLEIRARYPHRMLVYGPLSPFDGVEKVIDELERQASEWKINGIKLYPVDLIDGKLHSYSLADEKLLYPIFEKCLDLGIKVVGVHKSVPLGISTMDPFRSALPISASSIARNWTADGSRSPSSRRRRTACLSACSPNRSSSVWAPCRASDPCG